MKIYSSHWISVVAGLLLLFPGDSGAARAPKAPKGGLRVVSPANGAIVEAGEPFTVVVEPESGVTPAAVAIISPPIFTFKEQPPFSFSVAFPPDAPLGPKTLIADGVDVKERPLRGEIIVSIETTRSVESISVRSLTVGRPAEVSLIAGVQQQRLRVEGLFVDGTTRNISKSREITYTSSDPSVVTVTPDGLVKAVGEGNATVTITYKGKSAAVPVKVEFQRQSIKIDIKPGDKRNRINLDSDGFVRVAILSSQSFDPAIVDEQSVGFGPADAAPDLRHTKVRDVNRDGERDLVLRFRIQETGIQCLQSTATLTGSTLDGVLIRGVDSITPRGKNCMELRRR